MVKYEIPCPTCCKHVTIDPDVFEKGGIAQCRFCRRSIKIPPHPPKAEGTGKKETR